MHPTESRWRELLDGEVDAPLAAELTEHLSTCDGCASVLATLRRQQDLAAELLQLLDAPPAATTLEGILRRARRQPRRGRALIAAAIGLFLVTVAGATIRSGVLDHLTASRLGDRPPAMAPRPARPTQSGASPNSIAFDVEDAVTITFDAPQDEGDLVIILSADSGSSVSVVATDTVRYALGFGTVRIANRGASADYRVALPERLERASIRVDGRLVFSKSGTAIVTSATSEGGQRYRLPLAREKSSP